MSDLDKKELELAKREAGLRKELDAVFDSSLSKFKFIGLIALFGGFIAIFFSRKSRSSKKKGKKGGVLSKLIMPLIYRYVLEIALKQLPNQIRKIRRS